VANLIVVDNPKRWPLHIPGVPVVPARAYLTETSYSDQRNTKVFNLCRSYRYQSTGYYVSLLAAARGQKPLPSITTIQDMKTLAIARIVADDLDPVIQRSLKPIKSDAFKLSMYFGRNLAHRYDELCARLFRLFQAPLLQAEFARTDGEWQLTGIGPKPASDIPESHMAFAADSAKEFFAKNRLPSQKRASTQYDIAILTNEDEKASPSNKAALKKFEASARRLRLGVEFIGREDFVRLAEFDALFIRETTAVHHHTYRFARRAAAEGLVVIDEPDAIAKCGNKVYLAELLARYEISAPQTLIVHKENRDRVKDLIGLPCILKQPDSAFSQGVSKADDETQLNEMIDKLLEKSDLIIAQEFLPTDFDWRIGVLDRQPLFACKYHMVKKHWQIAQSDATSTKYGRVEAVPIGQVPSSVLSTALRAARLIGDGLFGVDAKQIGKKTYIIEVNDNPNIDAGLEDAMMGDALYDRIMQTFLDRINQKKTGVWRGGA
jgi:glutathione synthase/RimK-type ligase-like ATP-grasp enzyme